MPSRLTNVERKEKEKDSRQKLWKAHIDNKKKLYVDKNKSIKREVEKKLMKDRR